MPAMPRQKSKATKIAYEILGVPANLQSKKTSDDRKRDRKLLLQETWRAR